MNCILYYGIPPQSHPGEYEARVRGYFDDALDVPNYIWVYDIQSFNLRVMEGKAQERLFELMMAQPNLPRILELKSPYLSNIWREAYDFLEQQLGSASWCEHSHERRILEGNTYLTKHLSK